MTGSSGWSEVNSEQSLTEHTNYDDWHEDTTVPLPEPAVFISIRPSDKQSCQPRFVEEPITQDSAVHDPPAPTPNDGLGQLLDTNANLDLVVCACGISMIRQERSAHLNVCKVVAAASKSAHTSRRLKARLREAEALEESRSACKIQSMYRGYLARDYVRLRMQLERAMATRIQSAWIGCVTRRHTKAMRLRVHEATWRRRTRAAVKIQSVVRRWLAVFWLERSTMKQEQRAVVMVQSWWRGRVWKGLYSRIRVVLGLQAPGSPPEGSTAGGSPPELSLIHI
eukprot:TRINITY_DN3297_c0_g1_i2.p1 TRINITY_DN3297_c0_g1~~TRINITY_DN3297_c0_g1_i2.p1  ORF type:complete len:282 (-),score=57.21 TRINITY_DN3297_c0_g1_i2:152-997(-)